MLIDINSPSQENKINKLTPKEYLISPLEDIEKFFNGVYYLTQQQQKIVDEIINKNADDLEAAVQELQMQAQISAGRVQDNTSIVVLSYRPNV